MEIVDEITKRKMSDDLLPVLMRVARTNPAIRDIHINKDEFKIGRGRDNDEILPHVAVSRQHCVLKRQEDGEWMIQDVSSSGTILNGVPLQPGRPKPIGIGDSVQFSPSDEFLYTFILETKSEPKAKRARMSDGFMEIDHIMSKQKTFEESQLIERKELAEKMKANQIEQIEMKRELHKLLKDQQMALGEKDVLNKQIDTLKQNIEEGNKAELNLEILNRELAERLDKERLEFETKLNEEKQKMQAALEMSRQEKEIMETNMKEQMKKLRMDQQAEWKKMTESWTEEKKTSQAKMENEKTALEEKLKQMEEALKEKEAKAEELRNNLEKEKGKAAKSAEVLLVDTVMGTVEIGDPAQELQILDTIDLTIDTPANAKLLKPTAPTNTTEEIFNKVGDIMDEQLQCSVCSELFVTATTLNCTHTFCQYCINTWSKKKKECPVCRAPITSMNRSLVLDNFIDKMVENLPTEYKTRRTEIVEERRANEQKEKEAANKPPTIGRRGRNRGRGAQRHSITGASTYRGRGANPPAVATSSNRSRNVSDRERNQQAHAHRHGGRARSSTQTSGTSTSTSASAAGPSHRPSTTSSTIPTANTTVPSDSSARTIEQRNDEDNDNSSDSSDTENDSTSDESSESSSDSDTTDHQGTLSGWESRDSEVTDAWSDYFHPLGPDDDEYNDDFDDDFWGQEDEYIEGLPGSFYGGYGTCFHCGNKGHWAPGCPFE